MSATHAVADLDALLNLALENTMRALGLDLGSLWLEPHMGGIPRFAVHGLSPMASANIVQVLNIVSVDLLHTDVVADWNQDKREISARILEMGIGSSIIVPMLSEGQRMGGVAIGTSRPHTWSADEIALVEAVGREVGAAAERGRLFEETRVRLVELEGVRRVSIALRRARTVHEMLPLLLDETLNALDAGTGGIWLYDSARRKLKQAIGRGWCLDCAALELESSAGIPGKVFTSGDIYFSRDVSHDPAMLPEFCGHAPDGWSAICVPILAEQESIGALFISVQLPREFTPDNARLLVTLAEIAGNAIHRTLLHEQTERHAAELETRVKERTAELQAALQKAQEGDRLKTEFIANVNHELRTPLTNLVLYYQMLRAQPTVRTEERLDVIGRELQRLRVLIEGLLDLSRLDQGQVSFRMLPGNLNKLVRSLVEDRRSLADERSLTLLTDLSPRLPPVSMDEILVSQAISNLLNNALRYTPPGGEVRVRTTLVRRRGEERVGLSVQDNGAGIDVDDLPHLFDRFYRGKAGQLSGTPGTGLGLAIVRQVVERHHGQIDVDPGGKPGVGATFTIWLPVIQTQETG
jgi:signal transduction histidine kinase